MTDELSPLSDPQTRPIPPTKALLYIQSQYGKFISRQTLFNWMRKGVSLERKLKGEKKGKRWHTTREAIDKFMAERDLA